MVLPSLTCWELILTVKVGLKSSSKMLTIALFCASLIVAPPVGLVRVKLMVSVFSKTVSLMMGIVTVLLVSPLAKLTVIGVAT